MTIVLKISLHSLVYDQSKYPLDIIEPVYKNNPLIIIVDDDYDYPGSFRLLKSIKHLRKNVAIIFMTSDISIELSREVSPLGHRSLYFQTHCS